ncbi:MAG: methylmalonyl-CoA mutase family protein [Planctomycetota bacterium]|jgi:methylmalonyl-CoA mutase N-terminal domain/subunit|nr:methylmalonyl-CoA mutase family protein [Planctomycetota bacterium]MDP6763551.1 methylmalonyl-CoA mutase family protein [Planctomycetota bacterium]MDP6991005.1 methylmalonyl-CoA mutase family protein [Planctomycetota bacterium]
MSDDADADPQPAAKTADWLEQTWGPARARHPERREAFRTPSGLERRPLYGGASDGGMPGRYPFTRGIRPTMYRGRLWTMRQYAGFTSARETNRRFQLLLEGGQTGLSTAFDLPTQLGHDSDDPLARDEVGRVGVPVNSLHDVELLFEDIPLERVSTSMTINATAVFLLACYVVLATRRGIDPRVLRGTVQNDILKEYVARGNYRFPIGPSLRLTTDLMAWCAEEVPAWNTISISGYHIREAGATAVQELGFTFSHARAYVRAALEAGLAVDSFAPRLSFFFNAHNDLFEEVAKFRAARRIWARMMREEFGAADPASWQLRFHTQTAGSMLTSQQPDNNVVRTTVQALAAVLGGTQSLHTNSRDEALSLPSEASARLALRTQQVLAHESGVADVIDPLGGAPYVEALTGEIEAAAGAVLDEVERRGGAGPAIEAGHVQREIHRSAMEWQRSVEAGERVIVGVNRFGDEEGPPEVFRPDDAERERVLTDLAAVRARRDPRKVEAALQAVVRAARGDENIMPSMLNAAAAYATVGEVFGALSEVFGRYQPPEVI